MAARGGRGDRPPPTHHHYHVYNHFHSRAPKTGRNFSPNIEIAENKSLELKQGPKSFDPKMITGFHTQKAPEYQFLSIPLNLFDCLRQINFGVYWACCVSE